MAECSQFFEALLIKIQEEIHHFAGWEGGDKGHQACEQKVCEQIGVIVANIMAWATKSTSQSPHFGIGRRGLGNKIVTVHKPEPAIRVDRRRSVPIFPVSFRFVPICAPCLREFVLICFQNKSGKLSVFWCLSQRCQLPTFPSLHNFSS